MNYSDGNSAIYTTPTYATPTKAPEFEVVVNELEKAAEAICASLDGLEARLSLVMLPEGPTNPKVGEAASVHSQAVAHLLAITDRISGAYRRIENIKSRLEI